MNEIQVCKLVDGSMCIGKLGEEFLIEVVGIQMQETEQGMALGFIPMMYPFSSDLTEMVLIKIGNILTFTKANKELEDNYLNAISKSGIVIASKVPEKLKERSNVTLIK